MFGIRTCIYGCVLTCHCFSPVTAAAHHNLARDYGNGRNGKYLRSVGCSAFKELVNNMSDEQLFKCGQGN